MTVIAWDGKTLAADRKSISCGVGREVTKIWKVRGHLIGGAGGLAQCIAVRDWWTDWNADPKLWPMELQADKDDWCEFVIICPDGTAHRYQKHPIKLPIFEPLYATGCGEDFAMGAMAAGANAIKAVQIASDYREGCGMGVDWLRLD